MKKLTSKFYLVGIKGTGMSALACLLKDLNNEVTGSDWETDFFTTKGLIEHDIKYKTFAKENIYDPNYIYISSSCYDESNVEVREIIDKGFEFYYYHDFIKNYFKGIKIGVSGTHGKTTTTSFLNDLIVDKKATIIGDGRGYGNIGYKYFIFESCEYKGHFLNYNYDYLIINNIELDHLDYFKNIDDIYNTFSKAASQAKAIIIREDINIAHKCAYKFGKDEKNFTFYNIIEEKSDGYLLRVVVDNNEIIIEFNYPGIHMIENFLGALTVYYLLGNDLKDVQRLVNNFHKMNKRMEEVKYKNNIIISDYAHHPTEIRCLLSAIKQKYKNKKIVVLFQPHTYSRTIKLKNEFKQCFNLADIVYIEKTFTSAREKYDEDLENKVNEVFSKFLKFDKKIIESLKKENDLVIVLLGAGVIDKYRENLK